MSPIKLVIFDFDGTLVDTAPDIVRATNLFLKSKGYEELPEARIRAEIGHGLKRLLNDVYPKEIKDAKTQQKLYEEFTAIYEKEFLKTPTLFEGALEFLHEWDGEIAIVSNKRQRFIHPILEKLEIDKLPWAAIIGGDTYPHMKPHPEPFQHAMAAGHAQAEETLIVGDGIPDVDGALNIGSRCVAVDFGYADSETLLDRGAWKRLASYYDLRDLIDTIT